jgi:hypothetical protein
LTIGAVTMKKVSKDESGHTADRDQMRWRRCDKAPRPETGRRKDHGSTYQFLSEKLVHGESAAAPVAGTGDMLVALSMNGDAASCCR